MEDHRRENESLYLSQPTEVMVHVQSTSLVPRPPPEIWEWPGNETNSLLSYCVDGNNFMKTTSHNNPAIRYHRHR